MSQKMITGIKKVFAVLLVLLVTTNQVLAQAAILLNAYSQFFDNNGNPLSGGSVTTYIPNTSSFKTTWQDSGESIPNTNPIILDAAGRAIIYGQGTYRQVLKDINGNTIWDGLTTPGAPNNGSANVGDGNVVGVILPWSGLIPPPQYAFAAGQALSRSIFSLLYTTLTLTVAATCTSGSPILGGFSDTTNIPIAAAVENSCMPPGTFVLSKTGTTITTTNNSSVNTTASTTVFPFGNGDGSTTFNLPDLRGAALFGNNNMTGNVGSRLTQTFALHNPNAIGVQIGNQSHTLLLAETPSFSYTPAGSVAGSATVTGEGPQFTTNVIGSSGGGTAFLTSSSSGNFMAWTQLSGTISGTLTGTGATLGGSNGAHSIIPPGLTINYIIKISPDVPSSSASGVNSIGGMTGVIACGTGITCTANTISWGGAGGTTGTGLFVLQTNPTINGLTTIGSISAGSVEIGTRLNSSVGNVNSVLIGDGAGASCTGCMETVAIGQGALSVSTSDIGNVCIGYLTCTSENDVSAMTWNVAIGHSAMVFCTSCGSNVFIGRAAGFSETTGTFNTEIGHGASFTGSGNSENTAIGDTAGGAQLNGSSTIPVGYPNSGKTIWPFNGDTNLECIGEYCGKATSATRKQSFSIGSMALIPAKDNVGVLGNGLTALETAGAVWSHNGIATYATDSNQTLLAADACGGTIIRTSITAARTDTLDTAANIVAGTNCPGQSAEAGISRQLRIFNNTTFTETIAAGSGGTLTGSGVIPPAGVGEFILTLTNTISGTEAYTITRINQTYLSAPSGTNLALNAPTGQSIQLQVNGATFYNASSTAFIQNGVGASLGTSGTPWASTYSTFVQTGTTIVSSLPTCNAGAKGQRNFVTDANSTTFHATAVGGSTNNMAVVCDGTNWYLD